MDVLIWILFIALIICAVAIVVTVLMQSVKSSGLGATFGGETDSFYGKNQRKTRDGRLQFATKLFAVVLAVLCIVLTVLLQLFTGAGA